MIVSSFCGVDFLLEVSRSFCSLIFSFFLRVCCSFLRRSLISRSVSCVGSVLMPSLSADFMSSSFSSSRCCSAAICASSASSSAAVATNGKFIVTKIISRANFFVSFKNNSSSVGICSEKIFNNSAPIIIHEKIYSNKKSRRL